MSIIIPVLNGLEYVRECLESLYASPVSVPFEVIVIDQRSRDGTLEFLRGLSTRHRNFRLIENESNLGFGHAINQGAAIAKGEFLAIANSDVIVTPTWLDRLIAPMREDLSIGIVSPVTNYVGEGPQIEREAQDVTPETASAYAVRISDRPGIVPVVDRLVFFCGILRKKVFD
ncbi:MAG: glycosyltransferase [Bacteroidota bacterium]